MDIIELKVLVKEKGINGTEHAVAKESDLWHQCHRSDPLRMTMASDSLSTTNSPAG